MPTLALPSLSCETNCSVCWALLIFTKTRSQTALLGDPSPSEEAPGVHSGRWSAPRPPGSHCGWRCCRWLWGWPVQAVDPPLLPPSLQTSTQDQRNTVEPQWDNEQHKTWVAKVNEFIFWAFLNSFRLTFCMWTLSICCSSRKTENDSVQYFTKLSQATNIFTARKSNQHLRHSSSALKMDSHPLRVPATT